MAAGAEDPNALVQIEAPFPEPMLTATTVELYDGLVATGLPGRAGWRPSPTRRGTTPCTCTATCSWSAPARPASPAALDRGPVRRPGGPAGRPARGRRLAARHDRARSTAARRWTGWPPPWPSSRPSPRSGSCSAPRPSASTTTASSSRSSGAPTTSASPRPRTCPGSGSGGIRARQVVVATGAHERPLVFADNDRPGIMLAGAARTYLHRYGVLCGRRAVVFTTNDSAYAAAVDLATPASRWPPSSTPGRRRPCAGRAVRAARDRGARRAGRHRHERQRRASPGRTSPSWSTAELGERSGSPATCSWSRAAGTPPCTSTARPAAGCRYDDSIGAFVPGTDVDGGRRGRPARARFTLGECLARRRRRGALGPDRLRPRRAGARDAGDRGRATPGRRSRCGRCPTPPSRTAAARSSSTCSATRPSPTSCARTGAGPAVGGARQALHDDRHRPRPGQDVGRDLAPASSPTPSACASADLGTTTFRPPYTPVSFAALAGRDRGRPARPRAGHADPRRGTSRRRQVRGRRASGSGPGTTRAPARTCEAAVLRECRGRPAVGRR